jgi:hypothetical protein
VACDSPYDLWNPDYEKFLDTRRRRRPPPGCLILYLIAFPFKEPQESIVPIGCSLEQINGWLFGTTLAVVVDGEVTNSLWSIPLISSTVRVTMYMSCLQFTTHFWQIILCHYFSYYLTTRFQPHMLHSPSRISLKTIVSLARDLIEGIGAMPGFTARDIGKLR